MFHTLTDFIDVWKEEAKNTEKLLSALTDESLNKELVKGLRTLKQLSWHIIATPEELLGHTGLKIAGAENREEATASVQALIEAHRHVVSSVAHQIQTHWNNKSLHLTDNMYGEEWTRSQSLQILLSHLIHHRGQMTVFMRIAGLKVPGLYGPAKEEWAAFGLKQPEE